MSNNPDAELYVVHHVCGHTVDYNLPLTITAKVIRYMKRIVCPECEKAPLALLSGSIEDAGHAAFIRLLRLDELEKVDYRALPPEQQTAYNTLYIVFKNTPSTAFFMETLPCSMSMAEILADRAAVNHIIRNSYKDIS